MSEWLIRELWGLHLIFSGVSHTTYPHRRFDLAPQPTEFSVGHQVRFKPLAVSLRISS